MIEKQTITLDDLLQDTNPIGTMMQQEYQAYLELHPEADRLRYTDYTEAVLQTGAFDYQSIRDGQLQTENRVYFGAAVCTIIIGMFFPPVGLALGTILGGVQIVSAVNGQDLISGRELSTGEQITRGIFGTVGVLGGLSGLNAFSQNTAFVRGTEPGTLNHVREMVQHSSKSNYIQLNHTAQVMRSMSVAPVLPGVEEVSRIRTTKATDLNMTETVSNHATDIIKKGVNSGELSRPYIDSNGTNLLIQEIMDSGIAVKDNLLPNGVKWNVPGSFNGRGQGIWELVVDLDTNKIVHLNFTK